jgi:hypothetical protein
MSPGIDDARAQIAAQFAKGVRRVLSADEATMTRALEAAGIVASNAIKRRINEGPPPPVAESTIRARARAGSRGAQEHLAFMNWPASMRKAARGAGMGIAKPLVVTGALRNSITYVIRGSSKD